MKFFKFFSLLIFLFVKVDYPGFTQLNKESLKDHLNKLKNTLPKERVVVITDRDVYSTGDVLWYSGITYDILKTEVVDYSTEMAINLYNSERMLLNSFKCALHQGIASGSMIIPQGLSNGVYFIEGFTPNSTEFNYYTRKILIKNSIAPPFVIEAQFQDKTYMVGNNLELNLNFKDFYNEPKKKVSYRVEFFDGRNKISEQSGTSGKDGKATIKYKIPTDLKTEYLSYGVTADFKKESSFLSGIIPVLPKEIYIDFYPVNGFMVNDLETEVYFFAYTAMGKSIQIEGDLMDSDEKVATISSDPHGIGSFSFRPKLGKNYYVKISNPVRMEKKFKLPEVHAKGISLEVLEQKEEYVKYRMKNGYIDPRLVYLVGQSRGEIIWFSEHDLVDEIDIEVDLRNVKSGIAQFALINAAERLEGEHILWINEKDAGQRQLNTEDNLMLRKRGKISIEAEIPDSGQLIFTAMNNPWQTSQLANYKACVVAFPYDLLEEPFSFCNYFTQNASDFGAVKNFLHLYTPRIFSWSNILNTKADLEQPTINNLVSENIYSIDLIKAMGTQWHESGMIFQNNLTGSDYFYASNPQYFKEYQKEIAEHTPSYKNLLQNGTPILQVLKLFKPYNLLGNKIVFVGSNNSLNYQDGALIVIDGVNRGTDASVLNTMSPYDVESINVSTNPSDIQRYTGLNSVGLIEIELKKGPKMIEKPVAKEENAEFYSPDYDKKSDNTEPDYRATLYWLNTRIPSPQKHEIVYFNSDLISDVIGKIIFIPDKGIPVEQIFEYRIK